MGHNIINHPVMKPLLCFALLIAITSFIACQKDEHSNPYPVWILNATCVEDTSDIGIPGPAVHGCPQGHFHVLPNGRDSTVGCHDNTNSVKIWDHIDSTITIEYYITCLNYYDSDTRQVTFHVEDVAQGPGRDGPEVIVNERVILTPE
jgi:hypothetical protein